MRLLTGRTLGTIATVLVLVASMLAFLGAGSLAMPGTNHSAAAAPGGSAHLAIAAHATVPAVHPLAVPAAPTGLTVDAVNSTNVSLNWTNPTGGGLLNDTVGVGYTCTDLIWNFSTGVAAQRYVVLNLQSHISYCFRVSAWNVSGQSPLSGKVTQFTRYVPGAPFINTIVFTSVLPLYSNLPTNLAWQFGVANQTVHKNNTVMSLLISNAVSGAPVNNISLNGEIAAGNQTAFNITLDPATVTAANGGQFLFTVWAKVNNSANNSNGQTYGSGSGSTADYLVINQPSATLISPAPSFQLGGSNQTVVVQYSGDFINGASVNITQVSSGTVVYTESVFAVGGGTQTVAAVAPWTVTASGEYKVTIQITRPFFGASSWSWDLNASVPTSSQGFIYVNTTKWVNSTVTTTNGGNNNIDGLAPGVLAAILLVAGLIVGMIVALAMGRMMWGGGSKPSAPQAWSAKSTNECSVCHQTFASEDELKEHSKTAHGM